MLVACDVALDLIQALRPVVAQLRRNSPEAADQVERAASGIVLSLAEGGRRHGRDPQRFFDMAHGSTGEIRGALDLADAWGRQAESEQARTARSRAGPVVGTHPPSRATDAPDLPPSGTKARLRQARSVLDDEHGTHLPDDAFIAALCGAVLDGVPHGEPTGRAKFQIAVTMCERCRQGWQEGAGARIAIDAAAVERALCDAQHIGSIDGDGPERAHQDIPPSVARFVWRRDGGRCRVDGCRSARGLELHHLIHRADGGGHDASNIVLVCSACHLAHHRGALTITGTAHDLRVHRPREVAAIHAQDEAAEIRGLQMQSAHVGAESQAPAPVAGVDVYVAVGGATPIVASDPHVGAKPNAHVGATSSTVMEASVGAGGAGKLDAAILRTQAKTALTGLGWKPAIAHAAVTAAAEAQGTDVTLERLIFEALRRCPTPRA